MLRADHVTVKNGERCFIPKRRRKISELIPFSLQIFPKKISRQHLEPRLAADVTNFKDLQLNIHQSSHRRTSDEQSGARGCDFCRVCYAKINISTNKCSPTFLQRFNYKSVHPELGFVPNLIRGRRRLCALQRHFQAKTA